VAGPEADMESLVLCCLLRKIRFAHSVRIETTSLEPLPPQVSGG
jgi:hypothetical protein